MGPVSGTDIRSLRLRAAVTVGALAKTLACHRSWIHDVEGQAIVSTVIAERFVVAIRTTEPDVLRLADLSSEQRRRIIPIVAADEVPDWARSAWLGEIAS